MRKKGISRRSFIQRSIAGAAALRAAAAGIQADQGPARPVSANDKIQVGIIGVGMQGTPLLKICLAMDDVQVVAVSDLYDGRLARALELTEEAGPVKTFKDYRDLLALPELDAVLIVTPDHWHYQMIMDALEAGKDVYCEKPMTYKIEEGDEIIKAVKQSDRIVQIGSQWRSATVNEKARELINSGALGKITMVRASENRNSPLGAWYYPIPPDASPETLDWPRFLGPAPQHPFSPERFFRWRCWWDYSGGLATDLFVHYLTAIHYLLDLEMPESVVSDGGLFRWKDGRDVPDVLNSLYKYPNELLVNIYVTLNSSRSSSGIIIMGTEGMLEYTRDRLIYHSDRPKDSYLWITESWPKETQKLYLEQNDYDLITGLPRQEITTRAEQEHIEYHGRGRDSLWLHLAAFFDSVRTRRPSIEDAEMGNRAAVAAHMANLAYKRRAARVPGGSYA